MNNKIAILFDQERCLTSLMEATVICVYEKKVDWQLVETLEMENMLYKRENDIKNFTLVLIECLGCSKVIVGTLILGVPYYLLVRAGYEICEAPEFSHLLLEQIYEDYCKSSPIDYSVKEEDRVISKYPVTIDSSNDFAVDIIQVQKAYPELSTKKILIPFFTDTLFNSLEIKCSHIMPWLEDYLEQRNLYTQVSRKEGQYIILITHQLCSD